jgi:hypothetical protein
MFRTLLLAILVQCIEGGNKGYKLHETDVTKWIDAIIKNLGLNEEDQIRILDIGFQKGEIAQKIFRRFSRMTIRKCKILAITNNHGNESKQIFHGSEFQTLDENKKEEEEIYYTE